MKKIILILLGISILLIGVIYIIYKNNNNKNEEIVDIFKDEIETNEDNQKEEILSPSNRVIVDIKGMVVNPGVYEVSSNSRVNDVIALAGGLLPEADTSLINLAKIVSDEMTIIIYSKEEILEKYKEEVCVCDCPFINNDACINNETSQTNKLVNINTASIEELMTISGLGESKATAIIKFREENGSFKKLEDIKNVSGIGEALFEKIKDYITV